MLVLDVCCDCNVFVWFCYGVTLTWWLILGVVDCVAILYCLFVDMFDVGCIWNFLIVMLLLLCIGLIALLLWMFVMFGVLVGEV